MLNCFFPTFKTQLCAQTLDLPNAPNPTTRIRTRPIVLPTDLDNMERVKNRSTAQLIFICVGYGFTPITRITQIISVFTHTNKRLKKS